MQQLLQANVPSGLRKLIHLTRTKAKAFLSQSDDNVLKEGLVQAFLDMEGDVRSLDKIRNHVKHINDYLDAHIKSTVVPFMNLSADDRHDRPELLLAKATHDPFWIPSWGGVTKKCNKAAAPVMVVTYAIVSAVLGRIGGDAQFNNLLLSLYKLLRDCRQSDGDRYTFWFDPLLSNLVDIYDEAVDGKTIVTAMLNEAYRGTGNMWNEEILRLKMEEYTLCVKGLTKSRLALLDSGATDFVAKGDTVEYEVNFHWNQLCRVSDHLL